MSIATKNQPAQPYQTVKAAVDTALAGAVWSIVGLAIGFGAGTVLALLGILIGWLSGSQNETEFWPAIWPVALWGGITILIPLTVEATCVGAFQPDTKLRQYVFRGIRVSGGGWFIGSLAVGAAISFGHSWLNDKWEYSALVSSHIPEKRFIVTVALVGAAILGTACGITGFVGGACACREGRSFGGFFGGVFSGAVLGVFSGLVLAFNVRSEYGVLILLSWPPGCAVSAVVAVVLAILYHKEELSVQSAEPSVPPAH